MNPRKPASSTPHKRLILAATVLASSMAFIDGSVVNVALPVMQRSLSMGAGAAQWVVNAYMLMLGALVLVGGAAGDRYGRRKVFLAGMILFAAASAACGLAPGKEVLLAGRALQGLGAALLTPSSLALLNANFSDQERNRAMGAWAGFGALTGALGPVLGGWLADTVGWRSIFYLNLPIALAAFALTLYAIPESRDEEEAGSLDFLGAGLAAAGLGALTWGLTAAPDRGFGDAIVLAALIGGGLLLAAFLFAEAREKHPMMPLSLFKSPAFSGVNLLTLLLYFALSGAFFFLPFDLIRVQRLSPTMAGAAMVPMPLIFGLLAGPGGRFADRFGARWPLSLGPLVCGVGFAMLALPARGANYFTGYLPALVVLSLGMCVTVGPLTATVMGAVERKHAGLASGVNNAVARVAGLLAVASLGVLLFEAYRLTGGGGAGARGAFNATMAGAMHSAASLDSFHQAVRLVMLACGAAAALGGVAAFLTLKDAKPGMAPQSAA